ncbi:MAG: hypothetical protein ACFCUR_14460 [Rhodomicrobiaceae bacterium]
MFFRRPQIYDLCMKCGVALCSATGVIFLTITAAGAQSSCVRCTGPDATYYCTAESAENADAVSEKAAGLFCAARVASEYGHQICATQREATACDGIPVTYAYDEQAAPGMNAPRWQEPRETRRKNEPETLGEFAKDTAQASGEAVKNAGDTIGDAAKNAGKATTDAIKGAGKAIGDATKKTLKCLGSALNDC